MSFFTSSKTFAMYKASIEDVTNMSIKNKTMADAIDYALMIYRKEESLKFNNRYKGYTTSTLVDTGTSLSDIPDLWDDSRGFSIYKGSNIDDSNEIKRVNRGGLISGYEYRGDGKIYPYPLFGDGTAIDISIEYLLKPDKLFQGETESSIVQTTIIPILMEAEKGFEDFVLKRFFSKKGLDAKGQDAEAQFIENLNSVFINTHKAVLF